MAAETAPIGIVFTMTGLKSGNEAYIEFDDSGFSWEMDTDGIQIGPKEGTDAISVGRIVCTGSKLSVTLGDDGDVVMSLAFLPKDGADDFTGVFHASTGAHLEVQAIVNNKIQEKDASPNGKFTITY